MTRTKSRKFTLTGAASLLALSLASGAAYAQETEFDIEAQPLAKALLDFNEQSGLTVAAPRELVADKRSPAVQGEMEPEEALDKILVGSGLKSTELPTGAYTITLASASLGEETTSEPFRMAQVDDEETVREVGSEQDEAETDERREDVIVVTGTSIRGVTPDSAPLEIFTNDDILKTGATTLERFFETVPQNLNSINPVGEIFGPGRGNQLESGIDLRGLGVGTTLVLLNGRRLTAPDGGSPDISLIPLGAIERLELLTDGASAVYGADAIGGVVNLILKDDLDGAETNLTYGTVTDGSHERYQVNQSFGKSWNSGSALIAYSFMDQSELQAGDRDFVTVEDGTSIAPNEERHNVLFTVNQELSDKLLVFGDVLYSSRETDATLDRLTSRGSRRLSERSLEQEQFFISAGLSYEFSENLNWEVHGSYLDSETAFETDLGFIVVPQDQTSEVFDFTTKIDGRLFDTNAGEVKYSLGGGISNQEFTSPSIRGGDVFATLDRESYFLFAEVFVPLVSDEQNIPGIRRLELNGAARFTEYSDFGNNTSPRLGVLYSPLEGLNFRGTYAQGFRAPTLGLLNPLTDEAGLLMTSLFLPDPWQEEDGSSSIVLSVSGRGGKELGPETSDSFTLGFDFSPPSIEGLEISMTYFNIDYQDRLGAPDPTGGFNFYFQPELFEEVINTNPTREDIADIISGYANIQDNFGPLVDDPNNLDDLASVVTVIIDNRLDNLAVSKTDGLDLSVSYGRTTDVGDFNLGARFTYTLESLQQLTATSPELELLDKVGNPVSFKYTAFTGFSRGGFGAQVNLNYVDGYDDVFQTPVVPVDSWTTVDMNLSYQFGEGNSLLNDTVFSLNVNNLFDEEPPFVGQRDAPGPEGQGLRYTTGYDPVNANPIGRFVTVGVTKRF